MLFATAFQFTVGYIYLVIIPITVLYLYISARLQLHKLPLYLISHSQE